MQIHLNSYGTYLHIKDKMFEIKVRKDGAVTKHHIAAHKVQSVWVGEGIAISSDAVKLAIMHNIDVVYLNWNGMPLGRVWHTKLGSTTLIRKRQLEASMDAAAVVFVRQWLGRKVHNQLRFVKDLKKHRAQQAMFLEKKIVLMTKLHDSISKLEANRIEEVAEHVRGVEGTAGRLYFETISFVFPKGYQFNGRSFRPAKDAFNAFLNYGYGVLYSRVEKALILAGLDPYLGFLHRDDYNYKSMVYDFIEPYRVFIDKVVFTLFSSKKVKKIHTDDIANGMKLNKEGKELLITALNSYLDEQRVRYKGRNQTRGNIIHLEAHSFANHLIGKTEYAFEVVEF